MKNESLSVRAQIKLLALFLILLIGEPGCGSRERSGSTKRAAGGAQSGVEKKADKYRRREKTAFRQLINGQLAGKGVNTSWASLPTAGKVDFSKSSYNTYTWNAEVEVYIHQNNETRLEADYLFKRISATEAISDRSIRVNLKSGWLPAYAPKEVVVKEQYIKFIEQRYQNLKHLIPPNISEVLETAGEQLAFRSLELEALQETALGLEGRRVRVTKTVGGSQTRAYDATGAEAQLTRKQRDFIDRLSLTTDMELFPEDKKQGDKWTADGASLSFMMDPLIPGDFRGTLEIEYDDLKQQDGSDVAELKVRRAPLQFFGEEQGGRGTFNGWGSVACLLPARLIISADLQGSGEFQNIPQGHLIYGMQYEGAPEFAAIARIEEIPYQQKP